MFGSSLQARKDSFSPQVKIMGPRRAIPIDRRSVKVMGLARIESCTELEIDVRNCRWQSDAVIGHVNRRRLHNAHVTDLFAEMMPVENVKQSVLASPQDQVVVPRQDRGGRPEILVPIILVTIRFPVRIEKRNEPIIEC